MRSTPGTTKSARAGRRVASLLAAGAALFAVGSLIERSAEAAEGEPGDGDAHARGRQPAREPGDHESGEELPTRIGRAVGIDAESPVAVGGLVSAALALAALAWLRPHRAVLGFAAIFAVGHAIFDAIETRHQVGRSPLVAVLAAGVAVVHVAAGIIAVRELAAGWERQ